MCELLPLLCLLYVYYTLVVLFGRSAENGARGASVVARPPPLPPFLKKKMEAHGLYVSCSERAQLLV